MFPKPTKKERKRIASRKHYKKNSVIINGKRKGRSGFRLRVLKRDPVCIVLGCNEPSSSSHHIVYRSKWSSIIEALLGFSRDNLKNGAGLCAEHDFKFHNGDGLHGISGREYAFRKLSEYGEQTANYVRWFEVIGELKKSLIRKGVIR